MPKSNRNDFDNLDSRERLKCKPEDGRKNDGFDPVEFVNTKDVMLEPTANL